VSHKAKVEQWLAEARERLKLATPGTAWYRVNETTIREYEQLLERMSETVEREPGEDSAL
jgi:hypothetical protein